MTLSEQDKALRQGADQDGWPRITATRASEIWLRVQPPTDAFCGKIAGHIEFKAGNLATRMGHALEQLMLDEACLQWGWLREHVVSGWSTQLGKAALQLPERSISWTAATPDALLLDQHALVELKTVGSKAWAEKWAGGKRPYPLYVAQACWQMAVLDIDMCWLVALELGAQRLHRFPVERDKAWEGELMAHCQDFYTGWLAPYLRRTKGHAA